MECTENLEIRTLEFDGTLHGEITFSFTRLMLIVDVLGDNDMYHSRRCFEKLTPPYPSNITNQANVELSSQDLAD